MKDCLVGTAVCRVWIWMTKIWFDVQLLNSCQHSAGISKVFPSLVNSVFVEEQRNKGSLLELDTPEPSPRCHTSKYPYTQHAEFFAQVNCWQFPSFLPSVFTKCAWGCDSSGFWRAPLAAWTPKAGRGAGNRIRVNFALSPNCVFPFSGHEDVRAASEQPSVQLLALPLCLSLKCWIKSLPPALLGFLLQLIWTSRKVGWTSGFLLSVGFSSPFQESNKCVEDLRV